MRFGLAMLFVALVAVGVGQAAEPMAIEATVKAAIADFEPLWSPTTKSLRGHVIGIDPGGTGGAGPGERLRDDLSLLTAAHLYHFVIAAGGSPVLTRADDSQVLEAEDAAWQRQIALLQRAGCDVCVSIRHGESGPAAVVYQNGKGARAGDAALAKALGATCGVEPSDAGLVNAGFVAALRQTESCDEISACAVTFEYPPGERQAGPALRKACLHNAQRVFEGISQFCTELGADSADTAGPVPVPDYPSARKSNALKRRARAIWPEGTLPPERLDWFCRRFARESITNHSLVYFEVTARARSRGYCPSRSHERAVCGEGAGEGSAGRWRRADSQ